MLGASSLCLAMTVRVPAPRMALDNGGAAIAIRELDVWAGSNNLIESFDWRIMPKERWSWPMLTPCRSRAVRTLFRPPYVPWAQGSSLWGPTHWVAPALALWHAVYRTCRVPWSPQVAARAQRMR